jgi:hypothetical protein
MNNIKNYIESGILEMYVLGVTSNKENEEVMRMAFLHPDIQYEIDKISLALHSYLHCHSIHPEPVVENNVLEFISGMR